MHLTWARVVWGLIGAFLLCARVLAQPQNAHPAWLEVASENDRCIEGPELVEEVLRLLGSDSAPLGVEVHVQARGDQVRFRLRQGSGGETTRSLTDLPADCGARREAVALVLALAIEHALAERRSTHDAPASEPPTQRSSRASAPSEEAPTPHSPRSAAPLQAPAQPAAPPGPSIAAPSESAAPPSAPSSSRVGGQLRVLGGINLGLLPRPAGEARLAGELSLGERWALVSAVAFTSASRSSLGRGELSVRAVWSSLGACLGGATGAGSLHGCLETSFGAVRGEGHGWTQGRRDTTASGAVELAALGRWPLRGRLWLVWRLSVAGQWMRPRYEVLAEGGSEPAEVVAVTTFPSLGGRALLGLAWQIR